LLFKTEISKIVVYNNFVKSIENPMSKKKLTILVFSLICTVFFATILISGCSSSKKMTLAEIGNEKITLYDFEKQYLKSIGNADTAKNKTMDEKRDFLNLLIKFRLKVKDGRERGFAEIPEIKNEISDFKKKYVPEFLIDKEVVEPAIKTTYERKKYDLRTTYILLNIPGAGTPEDSMKVYVKVDSIYKELKDGVDFYEVAKKYTEDQGFSTNRGDTYYITAGMIPIEFEDAIYDLKVGDYTKTPIKINNSIFIAKLTDKRKRTAGIRVSHIMLQDKRDSLNKVIDTMDAYNRIVELKSKVNKDNFAEMASNFSEDPGSKSRGGDIGLIENRRRLPQDIDSIVFSLKVGKISDPVKSQFGWHLFLVTEEKEYESFDKQKEQLKTEFKKGMTYKSARSKYIEKLFTEYEFQPNAQTLALLQSKFDSTKTFSQFSLDSLFTQQDKQMVVAKYKDGELKLEDMVQYLNSNKDYSGNMATASSLKKVIEGTAETPILNIVASKKNIEKDDEFNELLSEYENGLISFRIDQDELFSKIKITNEEMQSYYDANKQNYQETDSTGTHYKPFDDVKAEISNTLQQQRFKEMENNYIEELKKKYPVKIYDDVLEKAFKTK
jgi:peptidyl-prolyl cis-trans isomerase SurA